MKQLKLEVSKRDVVGSRSSRRLRGSGLIPAVIYGKSGSESLSVNDVSFRLLMKEMRGEAALIKVNDGSTERLAVMQSYDRDSVTDKFVHIDFHEISADQQIHLRLPIHIEGEAVGVKNEGGVLQFLLHEIDVKSMPADIPSFIEVNIADLHVGEAIHIKDLKSIKGVTYLGSPETVIVSCVQPAATRSSEAEATESTEEADKEKSGS